VYFVLSNLLPGQNQVKKITDIGGPWFSGAAITDPVPDPLVFEVDPERSGTLMGNIYTTSYPLWSDALIAAFKEAGVDNLQLFNAAIKNHIDGKTHTNYKAVNILGLISCANMKKSKLMGTSDSVFLDADFDSLSIDDSRTHGALLFRLAENVTAILVREKVRDHVLSKDLAGVRFLLPENWSG
jgi:hypothetical protein